MATQSTFPDAAGTQVAPLDQTYEYEETRELVALVNEAAELVREQDQSALGELRTSRWRQGETYIFVLDPDGNMLVHPDPALEGKSTLDLKDINGRPIIRGLIEAATAIPDKPEGWYHYQWPVPGGLLPRWKSSYVRLVKTASGKRFIVGSGMYNDRMERAFVVDAVEKAVGEIERRGEAAFPLFHDPTGPFLVKDAFILVIDMDGVALVDPGFRNLEGRSLLDRKDIHGKPFIREMIRVAQTDGSGWVDYMNPRPGESAYTQKSTYLRTATLAGKPVMVACGVYLARAPKLEHATMTASELTTLVREAAAVFEQQGEKAYAEFRRKGSKWYRDDTYFFVWTMDGKRVFHAPAPEIEGQDCRGLKDVRDRPFGKMIVDAGASPSGEGWVHYMYPHPDDVVPAWKSTFVKRVTFPSGTPHIIGCGIYYMQMDRAFIEDVVDRACTLIAQRGKGAFAELRDKTGPFVFMDTYVFVQTPDGTELVNGAMPSLEGKNLIDLKDLRGQPVIRDEIAATMKEGRTWMDMYWYKPGDNLPARKETYLRKVQAGDDIFIVGSGIYVD